MSGGAIWLSRSIWDNPIVTKDAEYLAVWIWLLTHAVWKKSEVMFGGKSKILKPGELTTGRKKIASETKVDENKVYRALRLFKREQLIEQQTDRQCTLISILKWSKYQKCEQESELQVNNDRTTSEQRVNTKEEIEQGEQGEQGNRRTVPPRIEWVREYADQRALEGHGVTDAERFFSYYESNGWKVGKNPMKDWQAAFRTWERNRIKTNERPRNELLEMDL